MDCSTNVFLLMLTLFISLNHFSGAFGLPEATNGRIESKPGKRCLLYLWDVKNLIQPCTRPGFNFTLTIRLFKGSGLSFRERQQDVYSTQRPDNSSVQSFSECLYDSGENISCCQDISSSVKNITSGHEVSFSDHDEKITVAVTICAAGVNSAFSPGPVMKVLPWRDPCFMYKPCQQREFAVCHPSVDDYDCSCQYRWTGKNCTVLINKADMVYNAGRCLNASSESDVHLLYEKKVEECKSVCLGSKCKSFEFRRTPSSLHGNCTLRNTNSLQAKLVPCDADLFQLKSFLSTPSTNGTSSTPTKPDSGLSTTVIVIIAIIGVIVLAFIIIVLVIKPFQSTATPSRSHSNLEALPHGLRPGAGDQEMTPLAPDKTV